MLCIPLQAFFFYGISALQGFAPRRAVQIN